MKDSGSAIFTGLTPQLFETTSFSGDLLGPAAFILQSPPAISSAQITNGIFQFSVTNVPTQGAVAIQASTNLVMWLQVAFSSAQGTNLNYSFPATNNPYAFFRAKVIP